MCGKCLAYEFSSQQEDSNFQCEFCVYHIFVHVLSVYGCFLLFCFSSYQSNEIGMEFIFQNVDPIAFSVGPFSVRWYGLAYLAGIFIGWKYCMYLVGKTPNEKPHKDDIDDFLIWAVAGIILGGRLGSVLFYNLEFYMTNPAKIIEVWNGGMSFHGGLLGVIVAMLAFSYKRQMNVFRLSDVIAAATPIGLFFGRLANFVNGELYGKPTDVAWGMKFPDGGDIARHPSQLYEALLEGVLLFIILYVLRRCKPHYTGLISGAFLIMYGVFRALIEFVREPDSHIGLIGDFISMGQILCIPMIMVGITFVYLSSKGRLEFPEGQQNVESS